MALNDSHLGTVAVAGTVVEGTAVAYLAASSVAAASTCRAVASLAAALAYLDRRRPCLGASVLAAASWVAAS